MLLIHHFQIETKKLSYKLPENIQVIVKIASIELSPSKPRYNGRSWHPEGLGPGSKRGLGLGLGLGLGDSTVTSAFPHQCNH